MSLHSHLTACEDARIIMGKPECDNVGSKEAVNNFMDQNQLLSIIRGHEAQLDGYKMHKWNGNEQFPAVITIFSAPNYCDAYKNKGAVIKFSVFIISTLSIGKYIEYSTVRTYSSSLLASEFHESVRLVDTLCLRESQRNDLPHLNSKEKAQTSSNQTRRSEKN